MTAEDVKRGCVATMGARLGKQFYQLSNECTWLYTNWHEYEILFGPKPGRLEILNAAAGSFFRIVQDTLWEATLLHLSRLTDNRKDSLTLTRLPGLVDDKLRAEVKRRLSIVLARCAFARDWRNRRIAHRNLRLVLADNMARPLAAASREKVRKAIEAVADLLNVIEKYYRNATTAYLMPWLLQDAEALLYVLRDGLEVEAERRKRIESGDLSPGDWHSPPPV